MLHLGVLLRLLVKTRAAWFIVAALLMELGCGLIPERVSRDDPRIKPMFDAMGRVDRRAMGFTSIAPETNIRLEWGRSRSYDAMLHMSGKTARTVAFKRIDGGYEWIGEQEIFEGPHKFDSVDGTLTEAITINYDRVPISGFPINKVAIEYFGEEPELAWRRDLSLDVVRPWLKKWGYD